MFDSERGELSISMVAKELNLHRASVDYYVKTGQLRTIRKGTYHVILRDDLSQFMANKYGNIEEIAQNA